MIIALTVWRSHGHTISICILSIQSQDLITIMTNVMSFELLFILHFI